MCALAMMGSPAPCPTTMPSPGRQHEHKHAHRRAHTSIFHMLLCVLCALPKSLTQKFVARVRCA
jgi:hypothetical protein